MADPKGRRTKFNANDFLELDIAEFCKAEVQIKEDLDNIERF